MKHSFRVSLAFVCLCLCAAAALGQDETQTYVFGEYYVCDQNREAFADTLAEQMMGPVYDKHVAEGHLTGWGWLAHNAGGRWRRAMYYAANDLETLLSTRDRIYEEFQSKMADAGREFISICPEHDDLIWASVAGTTMAGVRERPSPATYSTYYVCDVSKQERADEIVKQLIAPEIKKLVESGEIDSWGWYEHVIGGPHRRLMTHRGKSHAALLAAVAKYNDAATEANPALANEFSEICNSHVDYLWDVTLPKSGGEN